MRLKQFTVTLAKFLCGYLMIINAHALKLFAISNRVEDSWNFEKKYFQKSFCMDIFFWFYFSIFFQSTRFWTAVTFCAHVNLENVCIFLIEDTGNAIGGLLNNSSRKFEYL